MTFLPLAVAACYPWQMMQLLPAIEASETAQFAAPLYGFHVMLASLPGELGSLLPRKKSGKRHCYNTNLPVMIKCFFFTGYKCSKLMI